MPVDGPTTTERRYGRSRWGLLPNANHRLPNALLTGVVALDFPLPQSGNLISLLPILFGLTLITTGGVLNSVGDTGGALVPHNRRPPLSLFIESIIGSSVVNMVQGLGRNISVLKTEELKEKVRRKLNHTNDESELLKSIDSLHRLDVAYHFAHEMDTKLSSIYHKFGGVDTDDHDLHC
ncbi:Bicyclogermacrene synthase [Nymphaea thermarum]|nr:Bicyclogermacrene synthase [Nymphaea thermarum]